VCRGSSLPPVMCSNSERDLDQSPTHIEGDRQAALTRGDSPAWPSPGAGRRERPGTVGRSPLQHLLQCEAVGCQRGLQQRHGFARRKPVGVKSCRPLHFGSGPRSGVTIVDHLPTNISVLRSGFSENNSEKGSICALSFLVEYPTPSSCAVIFWKLREVVRFSAY